MRTLVVGQGLAGTLASHCALKRGWDVRVIDAGYPSASSVAAGMYNPMSFRRIVEVWDADIHLRAMNATFREMEQILQIPLLHPLPIHKCLPNEDYAIAWQEKARTSPWLSPSITAAYEGVVNGGGWVNLPLLLKEWRGHLEKMGRFQNRPLTLSDEEALQSGQWNHLIDCRGMGASRISTSVASPSAPEGMDIRPNRGEILTLSFPSGNPAPHAHIQNFGKWTLPIGTGLWRLGASYEWNRLDHAPTEATRKLLIEKMNGHIEGIGPAQVTQHEVGLRPVSRDRRPAVGAYPGRKGWYILNGLGTRGVLIAPRWAEWLIAHIAGETPSNAIVQPSRLFT